MSRAQPFFSVIVPTYDRRAQLACCLDALARVKYPRDRFEVIVVDDGSTCSPTELVARFRERLPVVLLSQPHAGPAKARNAGAAAAQGDYLVFTDDDCLVAADWLQNLATRVAAAPGQLIGGHTVNALPENAYATATQLLVEYLYDYYEYYDGGPRSVPNPQRFFTSTNMAVPAARFRELGGFDESFPLRAAEDREFCDRWLRAGGEMTYASYVVVRHAHALTLRGFWRQHFTYGRGAHFFRKARARRSEEVVRLEPRTFYIDLLLTPLSRGLTFRSMVLVFLLGLSQIAYSAGYVSERSRRTRETRTAARPQPGRGRRVETEVPIVCVALADSAPSESASAPVRRRERGIRPGEGTSRTPYETEPPASRAAQADRATSPDGVRAVSQI